MNTVPLTSAAVDIGSRRSSWKYRLSRVSVSMVVRKRLSLIWSLTAVEARMGGGTSDGIVADSSGSRSKLSADMFGREILVLFESTLSIVMQSHTDQLLVEIPNEHHSARRTRDYKT